MSITVGGQERWKPLSWPAAREVREIFSGGAVARD
jgi:hypothetical protein